MSLPTYRYSMHSPGEKSILIHADALNRETLPLIPFSDFEFYNTFDFIAIHVWSILDHLQLFVASSNAKRSFVNLYRTELRSIRVRQYHVVCKKLILNQNAHVKIKAFCCLIHVKNM